MCNNKEYLCDHYFYYSRMYNVCNYNTVVIFKYLENYYGAMVTKSYR